MKGREVIDRLNKVINECILGAALIRVINSQQPEYEKFLPGKYGRPKTLGMSILRMFAWLIPIIVLTASFAGITILTLGGHFVITGTMTLGDFAAFNSLSVPADLPDHHDWIHEQCDCSGVAASYQRLHLRTGSCRNCRERNHHRKP